jgi:hypothetical protein
MLSLLCLRQAAQYEVNVAPPLNIWIDLDNGIRFLRCAQPGPPAALQLEQSSNSTKSTET